MMSLFQPAQEDLAELLGISLSSLRRYSSKQRETPDDVADRLHFVALLTSDLTGAYNDMGVRNWFSRKRALLDGKAPKNLLHGDWRPGSRAGARTGSQPGGWLLDMIAFRHGDPPPPVGGHQSAARSLAW